MVDQETVFTTDHDAVSGYPSFATPTEVGDALVNAGFDVIDLQPIISMTTDMTIWHRH